VIVTLRQPLSLDECLRIRQWRNDPSVFPILRTGYKSEAEQVQFYRTHISPMFWQRTYWTPEHQYYAVQVGEQCVGVTGLTYLTRVPGEAEISLVLGPQYRKVGIGPKAVDLLLLEAWRLGLHAVIGECYAFGNVGFWRRQAERTGVAFTRNEQGSWVWRWERPADA
jgi:RimJ/RimL family protein N-acetyltransferase